jgi:hypothetical protein
VARPPPDHTRSAEPPPWPKGVVSATLLKKKNVKEEGWLIHPQGVAGHPLGHGGGSATTRSAGLVVAEPPQWPKGVVSATLLKKKKKKGERVAETTSLGNWGGQAIPMA